jgi:hypothetical protein
MGASIFQYYNKDVEKNILFHFQNKSNKQLARGSPIVVYHAQLFFTKTFIILNFQLVTMFHLVATLCEGGGTLKMVVMFNDILIPTTIPQRTI